MRQSRWRQQCAEAWKISQEQGMTDWRKSSRIGEILPSPARLGMSCCAGESGAAFIRSLCSAVLRVFPVLLPLVRSAVFGAHLLS